MQSFDRITWNPNQMNGQPFTAANLEDSATSHAS